MDDLVRAEKSREDLKRALRGTTEELREFLVVARQRATTGRSLRARELWAIYVDCCADELIHRGHIAGGKVGGRSRSEAKVAATRRNVEKARAARVRERRYPPCPGYRNHSHRFNPDGRCYSPACREQYPDLLQDGKVDVVKWLEDTEDAHLND